MVSEKTETNQFAFDIMLLVEVIVVIAIVGVFIILIKKKQK